LRRKAGELRYFLTPLPRPRWAYHPAESISQKISETAMTNSNSNTTPPYRMTEDDEAPATAKTSLLVNRHCFDSSIVMITSEINRTLAERVCINRYALAQASDDPITVIISSPGGHAESGDMVHDAIKFIKPGVRMLWSGWVRVQAPPSTSPPTRKTDTFCPIRVFCCTRPAAAWAA
jgi:Clp protease